MMSEPKAKVVTESSLPVPSHLDVDYSARWVVFEQDDDHEGGGYLELTRQPGGFDDDPDPIAFAAESKADATQQLGNLTPEDLI